MSSKLRYFPVYPGDYLRDPQSSCSEGAQMLYFRLKMIAHDSERYGYLYENNHPISEDRMAQRCGLSIQSYNNYFKELLKVGIPKVNGEGHYFFPDMVELDIKRKSCRERVNSFRSSKSVTRMKLKCNANVMPSKISDGNRDVKPYPSKSELLPLSKIICAWKELTGYSYDDRLWDKAHWSRCSKTASELLSFFGNDWKMVVNCCQDVYGRMISIKRSCTLETVLKHSAEWKVKNAAD